MSSEQHGDGLLSAIRRWIARLRSHPDPTTYSRVIACRNCGRAVPIENATRDRLCQRAGCAASKTNGQDYDDDWIDDYLVIK